MTKSQGILIAVAVLLLMQISDVLSADDDVPGAKQKYKEGFRFFEEAQFPAALAAFEESYRRHNNPDLLYNIAMCQKEVFLYVEAISSLNRYLDERGPAIPSERKEAVIAEIEKMAAFTASIRIDGAPDGADVSVDGKKIAKTPVADPILLNPGARVLAVTRKGYEPFEAHISVSSGTTKTVNAELKQAETRLQVACRAAGSVVSVDRREVGRCPYDGVVAPGLHEVKVEAPNRRPFETRIDAIPAGTATVVVPPGAMPLLPSGREETLVAAKSQVPGVSPVDRTAGAMQIAGWVLIGAGVAAAIPGAVFTYRYVDDWNTADAAEERYNKAPVGEQDPADKAEYNAAKAELPGDRAGMIIGYTGAGLLIVSGIVLTVIGAKKGRKKDPATVRRAFAPAPVLGGIGVSF